MIDYKKLQEAHELSDKYAYDNNETCNIIQHYFGASKNTVYELSTFSYEKYCFLNIDNLITKLKELTQPQSKFKVGDMVWFTHQENIIHGEVSKIDKDTYDQYRYSIHCYWIAEQHLFLTKQEAIQYEIDYWTKLLPECQHEKDTYSPPIFNNYDAYTVTDIRWKCKKCGEYYP